MRNTKNLLKLTFGGIFYGVTGTIFVFLVLAIESIIETTFYDNIFPNDDFGRETLAVIWVFLGLSISAVFGNLFFDNSPKAFLLKWVSILLFSSIITIILEKIFSIYYYDQSADKLFEILKIENERINLRLTIKLFLILTPFTILFTKCRSIMEKIKV